MYISTIGYYQSIWRGYKITIKGKVHDVGYRLFLLSEAERLFIERFDARNVLVDGEQLLIVLVEGVEKKINRFVDFAESNYPPEASVRYVEVEDDGEAVRSIDVFRQSLMVFQLAKIAQAGVGMLKKHDTMLEKQDEMIKVIKEESGETREVVRDEREKTREVVEKVREEVEKVSETMKEGSEKTREVMKEESEETRKVVKENIEEDVEWLKEEIVGIKTTLSKVKGKVGMD